MRRGVKRLALVALLALVVVAGAAAWVVTAEPEWYERARYPLRYEAIVRTHARNYGSTPPLLAAVIYQESKFDASARSSAGAIGLMQLLPDTARGIAARTGGDGFVVSDLYDPEINVRYGSWYLRNLLNQYDDEATALAAYNAGPGNVDRWRREGVGIRSPRRAHYVDRVQELQEVYARAYAEELGRSLTRADRVGGEPPQQLGVGCVEPEGALDDDARRRSRRGTGRSRGPRRPSAGGRRLAVLDPRAAPVAARSRARSSPSARGTLVGPQRSRRPISK